jgi:hypothetical protein
MISITNIETKWIFEVISDRLNVVRSSTSENYEQKCIINLKESSRLTFFSELLVLFL